MNLGQRLWCDLASVWHNGSMQKPRSSDSVEVHVESIKATLRDANLTEEELRLLYSSRLDRMLSDNNRIWEIGLIFVSLAVIAIGALSLIDSSDIGQILGLGFGSTFMMVSWNLLADHHRGFQQRSQAWLIAIESVLGLEFSGSDKAELPTFLAKFNVRRTRWSMALVIVAFWVIAISMHTFW